MYALKEEYSFSVDVLDDLTQGGLVGGSIGSGIPRN
jgi:hypothetical protein